VETGISVENLNTTIRAIKELGASREVLTEPGYQGALILIRQAKSLVPVKTGALQSSMRPRRIERGGSVQAGGKRVPYANPIHWGWFKRHIKPQPFFTKALGYTRQEIYENYYREVDALIKSQASRS
jgi:hypothetical protein